jgi:hypothetical protein
MRQLAGVGDSIRMVWAKQSIFFKRVYKVTHIDRDNPYAKDAKGMR